ncbi:NAD-dependent epimerase/dehydratase [Corchorus olitorius]|uniref:NAD-dependent epimerase/dehydratase n=1 Tax=Corchorus olitorius TaxID=93759 RepID=A0A1R3HY20_9ROSI|nr:NAD-dependent epimerase/dehydratase [Corchorus olitorius]
METCQLLGRFFSASPLEFNHRSRKLARTPNFFISANGFSCNQTEKSERVSRNRMFILGMGFVGQFFAQELLNEGWIVSGTCTSMKKRKELQIRGFDVQLFDANQPQMSTMNALKCHTHLLVSIPPLVGIGDPMLQHGELLRSVLMGSNLQWLSYLSSTSVYGDCGGACVDEDYPTSPTNELAKLRLEAEQGWLNLAGDIGIRGQVFRLGGIYGPGRSAVDTIIKQEPLSKSQKLRVSKQFTSRVHVADICQALKASIHMPSSRRTYNIVDDDPAPRKEVFAYALNLVEKKWPGLIKEIDSPEREEPFIQKTTSRGEKRVSNARMKKELAVELLHPTYKSGLQSIIDQLENPF